MNYHDKMIGKPVLFFSVMFVLSSIILLFVSKTFIAEQYKSIIVRIGNEYFKQNINKDYILKRNVEVIPRAEVVGEIMVNTTFYDRKTREGNYPVKQISTNIYYEGLLPLMLVLVLVISSPVELRRKLLSLLIAFILINLYIFFKLYAFAYDNYNYPDYILKKLPWFTGSIVYYYNDFISISGYSFNFVIAFIIALISVVRKQDIERLKV